jgi:RNA polymerase sigma-70 factor (ECF subfamily)
MVAGAGSRTSREPGIRDTDERVLRALLDADERALRALIETYGRLVYGKALHILAEPALAEEVAQDVFLALWLDPYRFDPKRGSLKTFLVVVARHKAIDRVRQEQVFHDKEALSSLTSVQIEASSDRRIDDQMQVRELLSKLSPVQQEAILLTYFKGLTGVQAAKQLDVPLGTIKTRVRDGVRKLRSSMRRMPV